MIPLGAVDTCVVVLGAILLFADTGWFCKRVVRRYSSPGLWWCLKNVASMEAKLLLSWWKAGSLEGLVKDVSDYTLDQHLKFGRYVFQWMLFCSHIAMLTMMASVCFQWGQWSTVEWRVSSLVAYGVLLLFVRCPRVLNRKTVDAWCAVWMLLLMVGVWACPRDTFASMGVTFALLRFIIGMIGRDTRFVGVWNVLYAACASLKWASSDNDCERNPTLQLFLAQEIFNTFCVLIATLASNQTLNDAARLAAEAQAKHNASTALLSTMGDALVELNSDLDIVGPAPQLSCMLQNATRPMDGTPFERFLASDSDKAIFRENMSKGTSPTKTTIANMFHVSLLDCMRAPLSVEVFHACFSRGSRHSWNGPRHLLGIREFGDAGIRTPRFARDGATLPALASAELSSMSIGASSGSESICGHSLSGSIEGGMHQDGPCYDVERAVHFETLTATFDPGTTHVLTMQQGIPPRPMLIPHGTPFWGGIVAASSDLTALQSVCVDILRNNGSLSTVQLEFGADVVVLQEGERRGPQATALVSLKKGAHTAGRVLGIATLHPVTPSETQARDAPLHSIGRKSSRDRVGSRGEPERGVPSASNAVRSSTHARSLRRGPDGQIKSIQSL